MPSAQLIAPIPISPSQRAVKMGASSQDLYATLSATLGSKQQRPSTPNHRILEDDYTVPAPPPPSPVSFRQDHWSHGA